MSRARARSRSRCGSPTRKSCGVRRKRRSPTRAACRCPSITPMSSRAAEIRLRYLDDENEIRELEAKGLLATCIQHEIDHLDGRAVRRSHLGAEARHHPAQARQDQAQPRPGAATALSSRHGRLRSTSLFMGTPDFAATILAALIAAGHRVRAVYSPAAAPGGARPPAAALAGAGAGRAARHRGALPDESARSRRAG